MERPKQENKFMVQGKLSFILVVIVEAMMRRQDQRKMLNRLLNQRQMRHHLKLSKDKLLQAVAKRVMTSQTNERFLRRNKVQIQVIQMINRKRKQDIRILELEKQKESHLVVKTQNQRL